MVRVNCPEPVAKNESTTRYTTTAAVPLFMYENADRQRISLFVRKDGEPSRETAFRYAVEDGVGVFYWIDEDCGYALSGRLDRGQLLAIARVVYGQLAAAEAAETAAPKR